MCIANVRVSALAVFALAAVSADAGSYAFETDFSTKDERNRAYGIDVEENTLIQKDPSVYALLYMLDFGAADVVDYAAS